jgi:phosphohistidine phosphatase
MRLVLLRHAIAVNRGHPGHTPDAQRPLTAEGLEQAAAVGQGLKRLKLAFDAVLTSPYVRAAQTAQQAARAAGFDGRIEELEALRAEAEPSKTSLALKPWASSHQLLLVGHEPHLSAWIAQLVAGRIEGMRCIMKKGGAACIEVDRVPPPAGSGTLRWLMTPEQLSLIGRTEK